MGNPSSDITVRRATSDDAPTLAAVACAMAEETEDKPLDPAPVQRGVAGLFDHPQYGFYIVAETAGKIVGSMMITYEWTDWRDGVIWWMQSVYVAPDYRRRGVYRQLHQFIRDMAMQDVQVRGIRLYVERDNILAQKTYQAQAMTETPYKLYEKMFDSPGS